MTYIAHQAVFYILTFLFFFISCQNDDEIPTTVSETISFNDPIWGKTGINPENPANPFDSVGIKHNIYLESFWDNFSDPVSITDAISKINTLTGAGGAKLLVNAPLQQKIQDILDDPADEFQDALQQTLSSSAAQQDLNDFNNYVEINKHQEFPVLYSFITDFEDEVLNGTIYSTEDKRILLSFTSFIRHGIFLKKRRDDKDWDISIASRAGALLGATVDGQSAVYWTLIIGISEYAL